MAARLTKKQEAVFVTDCVTVTPLLKTGEYR